jgi:hypothetical protein
MSEDVPTPPTWSIRPIDEARIRDLSYRDMIKVTCLACSNIQRLTRLYLERFSRMEPHQTVLSLQHRFRCKRCRTVGYTTVSIEWHGP